MRRIAINLDGLPCEERKVVLGHFAERQLGEIMQKGNLLYVSLSEGERMIALLESTHPNGIYTIHIRNVLEGDLFRQKRISKMPKIHRRAIVFTEP